MSSPVRKITLNVPAKLLESAQRTTGAGITETIVLGLEELDRRRKRSALRALKGRVRIHLDLEASRR